MNSNIISLRFTRQIMAFVAMLALVMSLMPMQASAAAKERVFTASVSPSSIDAGQTKPVTVTITNSNSSSENIKSGKIVVPSNFSASNLSISNSDFDIALVGSEIQFSLKPSTGPVGAIPGESFNVSVEVTNLSGSGASSWQVCASKNNSFSPGGGAEFDIDGGSGCGSVNIQINQSIPDTGTLTVTKVLNDSNVDKNDFAFTIVDGSDDKYRLGDSDTTVDVEVGSSFNVTEVAWDSINLNLYNVQYSGTCSGSMTADGAACTITNTLIDNDTTLTLVKNVNNTAGGEATSNDWRVIAYIGDGTGSQGGVNGVSTASETFTYAQFLELPSKTWTLKEEPVNSEDPIITNYTAGNWQCVDDTDAVVPVINSQVTLEVGDDVTCTVTNTWNDPSLGSISGTKYEFGLNVPAGLSGWTIFIDANDNGITDNAEVEEVTDVDGNYTFSNLSDGDYVICEVQQTGYTQITTGQTLNLNNCHAVTILNANDVLDIDFWNERDAAQPVLGCTDSTANNYDATATEDDGSCTYDNGGGPTLCDDVSAQNYGEEGACVFYVSQCIDPQANLLSNGSFEEPVVTNNSNWQIFPVVSGWLIELSDGLELWKGLGIGPSDGLQNAELDGNDATKITQSTTTIPGATYELRFDFAARTANSDDNHIEAAVDGVSKVNVSTDNTNWVTYGTTFVADDASTDISFVDLGTPQSNGGTGTLLDNAVLCLVNDPTIVTYRVYGYVWEDENENGEWEGMQDFQELQGEEFDSEFPLEGWKVTATNGVDEYSTTTESDGYYYFDLPAGTWTITEEVQSEWSQTFPGSGSHVVTVPEVSASAETQSFFAAVFDLIVPTAHAQVAPTTYGPYNFGNVFVGTTVVTTGGGGGGGGSRATPVDRGTPASRVAGEATSRTPAVLPAPLVLGEQVSAVPYGAPATGHGGTSATTNTNILTLSQILYGNRRFDLVK